jgi:hypothetical protein
MCLNGGAALAGTMSAESKTGVKAMRMGFSLFAVGRQIHDPEQRSLNSLSA